MDFRISSNHLDVVGGMFSLRMIHSLHHIRRKPKVACKTIDMIYRNKPIQSVGRLCFPRLRIWLVNGLFLCNRVDVMWGILSAMLLVIRWLWYGRMTSILGVRCHDRSNCVVWLILKFKFQMFQCTIDAYFDFRPFGAFSLSMGLFAPAKNGMINLQWIAVSYTD